MQRKVRPPPLYLSREIIHYFCIVGRVRPSGGEESGCRPHWPQQLVNLSRVVNSEDLGLLRYQICIGQLEKIQFLSIYVSSLS